MAYRRVFAIGGSAGGFDALLAIAQGLPADLPAPILIVIHTSPESPGYLPDILSRRKQVVAKNAVDGEFMQNGQIYVARPDHHLIVSKTGKLETPRGPRENRSRPAIDPLFRSVALSFGARAVGVVLSGGLDDGAAGLRAIKLCNGTTVVQDPSDALVDSMPMNALRSTTVDYCLPASEMARLISELASKEPEVRLPMLEGSNREHIKREVAIAAQSAPAMTIKEFGTPSIFTCPDCQGALLQIADAAPTRFRCHTGHAYTMETLLASLRERTEQALWTAARSLQEEAMLLEHLATHRQDLDVVAAKRYRDQAHALLLRADKIQRAENKKPIEALSTSSRVG